MQSRLKRLIKYRVSVADSMVLIGIGLAASYWVLESILNLFTTHDVNFLNQLLGPDINEIWPRLIVFCLFLFFGSHVQFTINNRKKAEEALKESEEKYRSILESIEEGYYEVDLSGNFTFFNDSTCRMFGRSRLELMGMNNREYTSPETARALYQVFREIHQSGRPAEPAEYEIQYRDGSPRVLEVSAALLSDKANNPVGFRGVLRDVTERLKAQRERNRLQAQLQEARAATILGLAKLAEYRDEGTGTHLERMREYARLIAEQIARMPKYRNYVSPDYIEDIYRSSILHDIGKVGVPDAILLKPSGLTAEEFEIIKRHTILGGEALESIEQRIEGKSFLTMAKEIAYHHHEKWDGTGYPKGLKGDNIPLSARIVAMADVYDALTSKRFYKEAYSHAKARDIITGLRGSHFDPDVLDAFLASENEFERICRELHHEDEVSIAEPAPRCAVG